MKVFVFEADDYAEKYICEKLYEKKHVTMGTSKKGADSIQFVTKVFENNAGSIKEALLEADIIIYLLKENNIDDTRYAIKILEAAEFNDRKTFILISNFMSWSSTRKHFTEDDHDESDEEKNDINNNETTLKRKNYEPFSEDTWVMRKPHQRFKTFIEIEKRVARAKSKYLKSFVFFSGLFYGEEEDKLHQFFKLAWLGEKETVPVFLDGGNYIPMIHVGDFASVLDKFIENSTITETEEDDYQQYYIACDESHLTLNDICKSISKMFGLGGSIDNLNETESLIYDNFDFLTADVKFNIGAIGEYEFEWISKEGFVANTEKIRAEFEKRRNLTPLRLMIMGPPASGKSFYSDILQKKYRIQHLSTKRVIEEFENRVKEKEQYLQHLIEEKQEKKQRDKEERAKQKALQKSKAKEDNEENENNEGDEENNHEEHEEEAESNEETEEHAEEEEENENNPISMARKELEDLKKIIKDDATNRYDDAAICRIFKWKMTTPKCLNHGWILDGFPKSIEQARLLFAPSPKGEGDEDEEEEVSDNGKAKEIVDDRLYPDYVVTFRVDVKLLEKRVSNIAEPITGHSDNEGFNRRMEIYKGMSNAQDLVHYLFGFMEESITTKKRQAICREIEVNNEMDPKKDILPILKEFIGIPHNYGPSQKEQEEKERKIRELQEELENKRIREQQEREEKERQAKEEREKQLKLYAERLEEIKRQEKVMLEIKSQPLRNYLMENVIPTLTQGLIEVSEVQPEDPVDFLAEWLFKHELKEK
ncbi:hypothetical protein ABK040_009138 [Willaertia magna]